MKYKDGQRLIVKVIKSEADLPKENGNYYTNREGTKSVYAFIGCKPEQKYYDNLTFEDFWLKYIDWYLIPEEITDSDIEAWAEEGVYGDKTHKNAWLQGRIEGAKALLNNEIKHIDK
jgi:hypothetical protein